MLPPFIIEQIRQRERERERARREDNHRPRLELPIEQRPAQPRDDPEADDEADRGVVIVDLMG
jgi:hypothetical protein